MRTFERYIHTDYASLKQICDMKILLKYPDSLRETLVPYVAKTPNVFILTTLVRRGVFAPPAEDSSSVISPGPASINISLVIYLFIPQTFLAAECVGKSF